MADEDKPGDEPPSGVPSKKYDQDFFLALAAKGKDAWNEWRRDPANKGVRVTFAGIDFSEAPRDTINFEGFDFDDYADFSACRWRGVDELEAPVTFMRGRASFAGASFGSGANFTGAALGDWADLTGATFGVYARFTDVAFGKGANFTRAAFGEGVFFTGAAFGWNAYFTGATFGSVADFAGAAFGDMAKFDGSVFNGPVYFNGRSKEQRTTKLGGSSQLGMRHEDSWNTHGSGPDRFLNISFANARFDDNADFSGRSFEEAANFTLARFYYPPYFNAVSNAARIDFTGAHIGFALPGKRLHWTEDSRIPVSLRALRKIAEETKNHDFERDLYIEERKAERGVYWRLLSDELKKAPWRERPRNFLLLDTHILWILVIYAYWALADFGRSVAQPFVWLVLSVPIFHWGYAAILAPLMHKAGSANADEYNHAVWMLAFGNAVPFVGPLTIDAEIKRFLFCPGFGPCLPIPPEYFQLLVIFQNVFSITCVFFIGLALRQVRLTQPCKPSAAFTRRE